MFRLGRMLIWIFLLSALQVTVLGITYARGVCDKGWFGSRCQFQCRCTNDRCNTDGSCNGGSTCELGWFGPACQYEDLASGALLILNPPGKLTTTVVTDRNDYTCLDYDEVITSANLYLDDHYPITWLRLKVKHSAYRDRIEVNFRGATVSIGSQTHPCANMRRAIIDDYTVDIHCDVPERIVLIQFGGHGVRSLCSVQVSGGRNIALRQLASQSSTYTDSSHKTIRDFQANNSVDGLTATNIWHFSCSHTNYNDRDPWWSVTFDRSYDVNRIVLYDREKTYPRLPGFRLRAFAGTSTAIDYTESSGMYAIKYTIIPADSVAVDSVKVTPKPYFGTMQMCEVEVYGESSCDSGTYGRECELTCNCAEGGDCLVSTGGCPNGCATGFSGEDCQTRGRNG